MRSLGYLLPGALLLLGVPAWAQRDADRPVDAVASVEPVRLRAGGEGVLNVRIKIMEGGHANSNVTADPNLVPTGFTPKPVAGVTWGRPLYPEPKTVTEWYSTDPLSVFLNDAVVTIPFKVDKPLSPRALTLSGILMAQVCDHEQCYPPSRVIVTAQLKIESGKIK